VLAERCYKDVRGWDDHGFAADLARQLLHERNPLDRLPIGVRTDKRFSVPRPESGVRGDAIDAERADSAAAKISYQIETGLKNAGHHHWRPAI
jgi:hypothetical protein